uniref:MBD domain-containing protein n=1 Tax=Stomoxys calcitrans TaxID=35570 RepID=A0A1I8PIT0_STOCA
MAATSAGHQTLQQQQQATNAGAQQKLNSSNSTINIAMTRNVQMQQQAPQIHNLQQQQQLMQQYTQKQQQQTQQQINFTMQPQQQQSYLMQQQQQQPQPQQQSQQPQATYQVSTQPSQQQMQLKLQQQQQQLFQNQNSQFASNMMPCQNFMTPPPQLHTQPHRGNITTSSNSLNLGNTITWSPQYQNFQYGRKPIPIVNSKIGNAASPRPVVKQQSYIMATQTTTSPQSNSSSSIIATNPQLLQQHQNSQQQATTPNSQQQTASVANAAIPTKTATPRPAEHQQQSNVALSNGTSNNGSRQTEVAASDNRNVATINKSNVNNNNTNNNNSNVVKDVPSTLPKTLLTNGLNAKPEDAKGKQQEGVKANLPPGWRRNNNNNEIVYTSPTGVTLRSAFQIKDYLLSAGTCKCGLPCPLRPECFFNFNVQVPNTPLTAAATATVYQNNSNGFNNNSSTSVNQQQPTTSNSCSSSSSSLATSTIASSSASSLPASSSPSSSSSSSS